MEAHEGADSFGAFHDILENTRKGVLKGFEGGPYAIPQIVLP